MRKESLPKHPIESHERDFLLPNAPKNTLTPSKEQVLQWHKELSLEDLCTRADAVCQKFYGDTLWIRGLLEISNRCACNCLYCGIRRDNPEVSRYSITRKEILRVVQDAWDAGFRTFVIQSGEYGEKTRELLSLAEAMKEILGSEGALTLSCGILSLREYEDLKKAGGDRYLLRFETSSPELHAWLRNGVTLEERLRALHHLREAGFELGSGYMVGLPGETPEIRLQNALLCKDLELDMVGIGPFLPHPQTPLGEAPPGDPSLVREAVALVRLLLPQSNIPATTASATLGRNLQGELFRGGANVLMLNITPSRYRHCYTLYPGKATLPEDIPLFTRAREFISPPGKRADFSRGDALSHASGGSGGETPRKETLSP